MNLKVAAVTWFSDKANPIAVLAVLKVQGPAEIPDDLQTQLRVEPLARGICP
jgi:hypothetical protein